MTFRSSSLRRPRKTRRVALSHGSRKSDWGGDQARENQKILRTIARQQSAFLIFVSVARRRSGLLRSVEPNSDCPGMARPAHRPRSAKASAAIRPARLSLLTIHLSLRILNAKFYLDNYGQLRNFQECQPSHLAMMRR